MSAAPAFAPLVNLGDAEEHGEGLGTMMRCAAVAQRKGLPCVITPEEVEEPTQLSLKFEIKHGRKKKI